jgi:hypothetical protein
MAAIACPPLAPPRLASAHRTRRASPRVRRRRQVAAAVAVLLVAGVVWALGGLLGWLGSAPLAAPGPVPAAAVVYVVQPGDTVWGIARSVQPQGEVRPLVDRLEHELGGKALYVGERLVLN